MENNTDNTPMEKPSRWDKTLAGFCGGVLAALVTKAPIIIAKLFSIASSRIRKKPLSAEDIVFYNKINDMMYNVAVPATLAGSAIGWDIPEREYLKNNNSLLHTENAELKGRLYTDFGNSKSWTDLERIKTESAGKVEQER